MRYSNLTSVTMARLGMIAENRIDRDLLELIPEDRPGIRFNDLVEKASRICKRPTVWKRLEKFKRIGIVIQEKGFYRKDPLDGRSLQTTLQITTGLHDPEAGWGTWKNSFPRSIDASKMRMIRSRSLWEQKELNPSAHYESLADGKLQHALASAIVFATSGYLQLLQAVAQTPDLATAHEITDVLLDIAVTQHLELLARLVWQFRKKLSFEELNGKRLNFEFVTHDYAGWDFTVWPPVPP